MECYKQNEGIRCPYKLKVEENLRFRRLPSVTPIRRIVLGAIKPISR